MRNATEDNDSDGLDKTSKDLFSLCIPPPPPPSDTRPVVSCVVTVVNPLDAVNMSDGYAYKSQLTPLIADVSPRRGGTAGGTRLTISGSGFR